LIKKGDNREVAILQVLKRYITESRRILFEGNNYSDEWAEEAKRRGLNNIKTTPEALDVYESDKTVALFERNNVFTHVELEARHEIELEKYTKKVQIESRVLREMALTYVVPAAVQYQNQLIENIRGLKEIGLDKKMYESQMNLVREISEHVNIISVQAEAMRQARKAANNIEDNMRDKAIAYCHQVKPFFDDIRYHIDKLELIVDDKLWPVPKYRELLLMR
jgi:glutamine synthetase